MTCLEICPFCCLAVFLRPRGFTCDSWRAMRLFHRSAGSFLQCRSRSWPAENPLFSGVLWQRVSRSGRLDRIDNIGISIVHQGTIKPRVLVRLAVRCTLVAFLFDATLGMAQDGVGRSDNQPNNVGAVRQAHVDPRTITLPVVDGNCVRFTRLSTTDGLSQRRVSQIVQDDLGFMWFGTQYGLNRYDGHNFKVFVPDPRNPNSLSGVFISALFKDRDGTLWVGCDRFLNKFEPATETFARYPVPYVNHISQDTAGTLWLATNSGLCTLKSRTATRPAEFPRPQHH